MSKVTISEWYERVTACWPEGEHRLTPEEMIKAAKKLYRFAMGRPWGLRMDVKQTSGNRRAFDIWRGEVCINTERAMNGAYGLVHAMSHYCHRELNPSVRPHGAVHARLEMAMIKEVVKRGWLDGTLKVKPKPAAVKPDPRQVTYDRILAGIERWEKKENRAKNALKKLRRRASYFERKYLGEPGKPDSKTVH